MSEFRQIGQCLRDGDAGGLVGHLANLIREHPTTWADEFLSLGGIPDPQSDACDNAIAMLRQALTSLGSLQSIAEPESRRAAQLLQLLVDYREKYVRTKRILESSKFLEDGQAVRLWRLASHVEDQFRLLMQESRDLALEGGEFNTVRAAHSALADEGGAYHNLQDIWEGLVECVELVMRFLLHRDGVQALENPALLYSSYNDPHITHILRLAARWRALQLTYDNLRYCGWERVFERLHDGSGQLHSVETHRPLNPDDLLRKHVSFIRHQLFTVEMFGPSLQLLHHFTDNPENIAAIARSIRVPQAGNAWDGNVDIEALQLALKNPLFPVEVEVAIDTWHFRPWVKDLIVNYRGGAISWEKWVRARCGLQIVAQALIDAINTQVEPDLDTSLCRVIRVSKRQLVVLLEAGSGLEAHDCERAIASLTFDAERRGADWWDMPLLPLGNVELIIVPSVLAVGNPTRCLEAAVRRDSKAVSVRSESFNRHVLEPFIAVGAHVEMGFTINGYDGRPVEFDGIAWWQGRLLLLEAKCLRSLEGPHDDWRARREIDYAIEQLARRRNSIERDWGAIRSRLANWNLPNGPPTKDSIICVAVTNVMRFTTEQLDGIIVTDALCLRRFFAKDPYTYYISTSGERRMAERIRVGELPTSAEITTFLTSPLHLQWIFQGFTFQWQWISPFSGENPIRFATAAFEGRPELQ